MKKVTGVAVSVMLGLLVGSGAHAGGHGRGWLDSEGGLVRTCDDWRVQIDGERPLLSSETLELAAPPSGPLTIEAARNGGVSIEGAAQSGYSVTVCRAIRERAGRAALDTIQVVRSADKLKVTGPAGDGWVAYLIVRAPRQGSLQVSAHNGPIDARDFSGRLDVRSVNGPVDLERVGGEVVAETTNGPIQLDHGSGDVSLRAQNGPLSVRLSGSAWEGKGLQARTTNGPLSLDVPRAFASGVEVRASGHSPWRCPESACSGSWSDDERVARLGSGDLLVSMETHNGPVTIHQD